MRHVQFKGFSQALGLFYTKFSPQCDSEEPVAQMLGLELKRNALQFQRCRFGKLVITKDLNGYRFSPARCGDG
jgi:hypothetical protein